VLEREFLQTVPRGGMSRLAMPTGDTSWGSGVVGRLCAGRGRREWRRWLRRPQQSIYLCDWVQPIG